MIQFHKCLGLRVKSGNVVRPVKPKANHLQGNYAAEAHIARAVDFTHPPNTQGRLYDVMGDLISRWKKKFGLLGSLELRMWILVVKN
jgi:hypothetical protein